MNPENRTARRRTSVATNRLYPTGGNRELTDGEPRYYQEKPRTKQIYSYYLQITLSFYTYFVNVYCSYYLCFSFKTELLVQTLHSGRALSVVVALLKPEGERPGKRSNSEAFRHLGAFAAQVFPRRFGKSRRAYRPAFTPVPVWSSSHNIECQFGVWQILARLPPAL